jgi:hypothetical protein
MVAAAAVYGELEFRGYVDDCAETCEACDWSASSGHYFGKAYLVQVSESGRMGRCDGNGSLISLINYFLLIPVRNG